MQKGSIGKKNSLRQIIRVCMGLIIYTRIHNCNLYTVFDTIYNIRSYKMLEVARAAQYEEITYLTLTFDGLGVEPGL